VTADTSFTGKPTGAEGKPFLFLPFSFSWVENSSPCYKEWCLVWMSLDHTAAQDGYFHLYLGVYFTSLN
jgi:hypothetical protein